MRRQGEKSFVNLQASGWQKNENLPDVDKWGTINIRMEKLTINQATFLASKVFVSDAVGFDDISRPFVFV